MTHMLDSHFTSEGSQGSLGQWALLNINMMLWRQAPCRREIGSDFGIHMGGQCKETKMASAKLAFDIV